MLGKKEEEKTDISIFSATPTYLKLTFVSFSFFSMNLSLMRMIMTIENTFDENESDTHNREHYSHSQLLPTL